MSTDSEIALAAAQASAASAATANTAVDLVLDSTATITTVKLDAEAARDSAASSASTASSAQVAASTAATTATSKAAEAQGHATSTATSATSASSAATSAAASAAHADEMAGATEAVAVSNDTIMTSVASNHNTAFAQLQSTSLGGPWKATYAYVIGDVFSRPSDGQLRFVTTAHTSGSAYSDANSTSAPDWRYLRTVSNSGSAGWTTQVEAVARGLGWIIATDLRYAGGVDPTGIADSSNAMDAIALAAAGIDVGGNQPAYPIALRDSVAPIWLPAGTIKLTRRHQFVSMKSLTIKGAGPRATTLLFYGLTTDGTGVAPTSDPSLGDALSFVSCPGLSLSDFRVNVDTTSTINGSALGIDCMPGTGGVGFPKGTTTGSRMRVARVYVEGQGKWINGIAVGRNSNTFDLANFYGYNLSVGGPTTGKPAPLTYDATYWQNGVLFGSSGSGNLLNYTINTCTVDYHKNAYVNNVVDNVSLINCNSSHSGIYLTVFGRNNTKASAFRCESTERLLVRGPTVSAPGKVTLEDYSFGDNGTDFATDRQVVQWTGGGTLVLRQSTWDANSYGSAYNYKIYASTNTTQQLNILIDGITLPNDTAVSMFADVPSGSRVFAKWRGRTQYGTGGSSLANHEGGGSWTNSGAVGDLDIITVQSNTQTGTAYTLVLANAGKAVTMNNASANAVTVPPASSVAFPLGAVVSVEQLGAGVTTIVGGAGVTIRSRGSLVASAGQYAAMSLRQISIDEWLLTGDLA